MDNSMGNDTGDKPDAPSVHEPFTLAERFQQLADIDNVRGPFPHALPFQLPNQTLSDRYL